MIPSLQYFGTRPAALFPYRMTPPTTVPRLSPSAGLSVALMLNFKNGTLTISDPSQTLTGEDVQVVGMTGTPGILTVDLPVGPGGLAGSSVSRNLFG
jgi:hypothetical protein